MESILQRMQGTAQQYVEILSEILGIDVSIIDDQQMRIAGSGRIKARTGSVAAYGNIIKHALETKSLTVVDDPLDNPLCAGCISRDWCDNLCEIWTPILLRGKPIGVIGCVCYTPEQKAAFLEKRSTFEQFFQQFSGLLKSRAYELEERERNQNVRDMLEHVLKRAQVGVLILDSKDRIHDINQQGKILLFLDEAVNDYADISITPGDADKPREYLIHQKGSAQRIVADIYQIAMDPYDRLVLFGDANLRSEAADELLGLAPSSDLDRIIGRSQAVCTLKKNICQIAPSSSNVLVTGESGTGKELVAHAIHSESPRKNKPFIAINCAALPENLLESELFGYVKGAFTGANAQGKVGLLEAAQGGTFFLDEVSDMPLSLQVKLLRVLEQREIRRIGSNTPIPIDVRFVFATNCDLEHMVSEGTFRRELYYRINVVPLTLPPLRERREDIRLIAASFIRKFSSAMGKPCSGISEDFWSALEEYPWPGNIRELQNAMEFAVNMMPTSGVLRSELLRKKLSAEIRGEDASAIEIAPDWTLADMEKEMIRRYLRQYENQKDGKRLVAQKLGIGIATLYRKIQNYNLS